MVVSDAASLTATATYADPLGAQAETALSTLTATYAEANAEKTEATTLTIGTLAEAQATPLEAAPTLTLGTYAEAIAAQGETTLSTLTATYQETSPAKTEAAPNLTIGTLAEANATPAEVRQETLRYWAGSSSGTTGVVNPNNANGTNDAAFAVVTTTITSANPAILTSTTFSVPGTGTFSSKSLRVWFDVPARTTPLDTLKLFYNIGGGDVAIYTHAGTALVNHDAGDFTFDVSALTLAQLGALSLKASYTATVAAAPETKINVDAWCVELIGAF